MPSSHTILGVVRQDMRSTEARTGEACLHNTAAEQPVWLSQAHALASQTGEMSAGSNDTGPNVVPPSTERATPRQWQLLPFGKFGKWLFLILRYLPNISTVAPPPCRAVPQQLPWTRVYKTWTVEPESRAGSYTVPSSSSASADSSICAMAVLESE